MQKNKRTKTMSEKNKPNSLNDFDIRTDATSSESRSSIPKMNQLNSVMFALAIGGMAMTGCSDEKTCSDSDVSYVADGNGSTAYDTFDSFDYGGDTDVNSNGDTTGNGDECRDYD
jgi:hypothetical protein